jgi:stage IV sporulation protein FB
MKSPRATWTVGHYRGAPVRLHLTLVLGALFFSHFRVEPGAWLGFALVILLHELGHALLVARYRLEVEAIDLHALGGECSYSGEVSAWQRSVIAWGGVLAQSTLLAAAGLLLAIGVWPEDRFASALLGSFLWPNAFNMALNLLPIEPLDGARAWQLFPRARARLRRRRQRQAAAALRAEARAANATPPLSTETIASLQDLLDRARRGGRG